MRALPFPQTAVSDRESSYDHATPVPYLDDIPIDPALSQPVIDPALMENGMNGIEHIKPPRTFFQPPPHIIPPESFPQYSDAPQGDPFAPQPLPITLHMLDQPAPTPKPLKRKRKRPRERECGFCEGDDQKNKEGLPEKLITCNECGRSGHPSCMKLAGIGDVLHSYDWKCTDCKTCEVCSEKGDDARMLFCDSCDRGWHMYCMDPPIEVAPEGQWYCPLCHQFATEEVFMAPVFETPAVREASVASSSRPYQGKGRGKGRGKGKGKPKATSPVDYQSNDEAEIEILATPKGRGRSKKKPQSFVDEPLPTTSPRLKRSRAQHSPVSHPLPRIRLRFSSQKGKEKECEEEDMLKGIFDDILTDVERDVSKTSITTMDKERFDASRMTAERKLAPPPPPTISPASDVHDSFSTPGPSSRPLRSHAHQASVAPSTTTFFNSASPAPSSATPAPKSKQEHHPLRIRSIRFGEFEIQTWYDAPFPEEYATIPDGQLWICEFCLKYMKSQFACERHRLKCKSRHPPGDEIYRDGNVSVFEVDGRKNKIYCQNLCLLSKMFLDHKSLFYDVEPFLFYVITETDEFGARFVGYFSKEKQSLKDYNLSCIMTLPVRQRQGWGNLLIDFSYLLSKKEQRTGSPEKPLSDLGALGYRNYWTLSLMRYLEAAPERPRLEDISKATSMIIEDIFTTLQQQQMISVREVTPPPAKPLPGQSIRINKGRKSGPPRRHLQRTQANSATPEAPKGPFVPPTDYEIVWDPDLVSAYLRRWESKGYLQLKPERLQWSPYVMTRQDRTDAEKLTAEQVANLVTPISPEPEVVEVTTSSNNSQRADAQASMPAVEPFPSPLNIFDDDDEVEEVPRPSQDAPKPRPRSQIYAKAPRLKQVPQSLVDEPRSTRGRLHESSKDEGAAAITGRALRSRPNEPVERTASLIVTKPASRKRARVVSSDAEGENEHEADTVVQSLSPHNSGLPNGNHSNGDTDAPDGTKAMDFDLMPVETVDAGDVIPVATSTVREGNLEDSVKSEETTLPSDETLFGTDDLDADGDADADGEYEEDAEGEPDDDEGEL